VSPQAGRYLIFAVIGVGLFLASIWEIARALRSGRLRLRVSTITRVRRPGLFWFDVGACGFTAILAALFAYHFIVALLGQL
jgi:PIN domain nuclease of toxin-antitoxin system